MNNNRTTYVIAGVLGITTLIIIIAVVFVNFSSSKDSNSNTSTTTTNNASSSFKDGSYSSTINYFVQGNRESITVSITIANNAVASVENQLTESNSTSAEYQGAFDSNYKSFVVGKKISSINLSRVAGATETTDAFMQALQKIKTNAAI